MKHTTLRNLAAAALLAAVASSCGGTTSSSDGGADKPAATTISGTFEHSNGTVAPEFQRTTKVVVTTKGGTTRLEGTLSNGEKELATQGEELDAKTAEMLAEKVQHVGEEQAKLPKGAQCSEPGGAPYSMDMTVGGEKVVVDSVMSTPECEGLYFAMENVGIALAGLVPDAFPGLEG